MVKTPLIIPTLLKETLSAETERSIPLTRNVMTIPTNAVTPGLALSNSLDFTVEPPNPLMQPSPTNVKLDKFAIMTVFALFDPKKKVYLVVKGKSASAVSALKSSPLNFS